MGETGMVSGKLGKLVQATLVELVFEHLMHDTTYYEQIGKSCVTIKY